MIGTELIEFCGLELTIYNPYNDKITKNTEGSILK
jgi:hypothetical protein